MSTAAGDEAARAGGLGSIMRKPVTEVVGGPTMDCVLTHLTWNQNLIVGHFHYMVMIATETVQESSTRSF